MAIVYLRSTDGDNADDGSTWALAKATLAAALTAAGAGGTVYVSQAHAETQASAMSLASPGTAAAPVIILCCNDAAEPPTALATTATVTMTGGSGAATTFSGFAYSYGVSYIVGTGASNSWINLATFQTPFWWKFDTCFLNLAGNSASSRIAIGQNGATMDDTLIELVNTPLGFSNAAHSCVVRCPVTWQNTPSAISGTPPTVFFSPAGGGSSYARVECHGIDLSAMGSGTSLVKTDQGSAAIFNFANCELGSAVAVTSGAIVGQGGVEVYLDNCDSADTNYRMEHYKYQGSIKSETSKIRSGGASDGTTPISWNMTSTSGASFFCPLQSPNITAWNETISQITVTVEIALDSAATALNDDEIWLEVEYLGTSGVPLSLKASDRKTDVFAAAAAQTTSTITWDNMTTPTKQKLAVTFTPAEKGVIAAKVMLAKASVTAYVDPLITVS